MEKIVTLADHAEAWTREQGKVVPARDTPEWDVMYAAWVDVAFADFPEEITDPIKKRRKSRNG